MLKMYRAVAAAGGEAEFWDANWDGIGAARELADNDRVCENQPMWPALVETLRPDRLFLEGGCGPGHWVKYFHDRGYRALGLDFAPRTVERVKRVAPELDVRVGDVLALPLGDGEVHAYYSGGVVEHFEAGPERALAEARRVLAPDGWFLCSVPDANPLRDRLLYRRAETDLAGFEPRQVVRRVRATEEEPPPDGTSFFQYVFTPDEFRARLHAAGFEVVRTFGYAAIWCVVEVPGVQRAFAAAHRAATRLRDALARTPAPGMASSDGAPATAVQAVAQRGARPTRPALHGARGLFIRTVVREDRSTPVVGRLVAAATELAPNMRMYVARPR